MTKVTDHPVKPQTSLTEKGARQQAQLPGAKTGGNDRWARLDQRRQARMAANKRDSAEDNLGARPDGQPAPAKADKFDADKSHHGQSTPSAAAANRQPSRGPAKPAGQHSPLQRPDLRRQSPDVQSTAPQRSPRSGDLEGMLNDDPAADLTGHGWHLQADPEEADLAVQGRSASDTAARGGSAGAQAGGGTARRGSPTKRGVDRFSELEVPDAALGIHGGREEAAFKQLTGVAADLIVAIEGAQARVQAAKQKGIKDPVALQRLATLNSELRRVASVLDRL